MDLRLLKLSPEEGFVWSRLSGPTTMRDLVALTGLDEEHVVAIVRRLASEGAVEIEGDEPPSFRPPAPSFSGIDELEEIDAVVTLEVAIATHAGHVRSNNEDAFAVVALRDGWVVDASATSRVELALDDHGVLLAVTDGMGGANAGEVAAAIVVDSLRAELSGRESVGEPSDALRDAALAAHQHVAEASLEPGREGMGATLIAVLVRGGAAYSAEVGDSRFYVFRGGCLTQISRDQTYVAALLAHGIMTVEEAKASRAKHVVLQVCGRLPGIQVAQRRLELRARDVLLLCSDGLSGQVDDAAIARILADHIGSLREACARLVAAANDHGGHDNVTVVLARVGNEAAKGDEPAVECLTVLHELEVDG